MLLPYILSILILLPSITTMEEVDGSCSKDDTECGSSVRSSILETVKEDQEDQEETYRRILAEDRDELEGREVDTEKGEGVDTTEEVDGDLEPCVVSRVGGQL